MTSWTLTLLVVLASVWGGANGDVSTDLSAIQTTANNTVQLLDNILTEARLICPNCSDPRDEDCFQLRLAATQVSLQSVLTQLASLSAVSGTTCCRRYTPPLTSTGDPGFVVFDQGKGEVLTFDSAGTLMGNTTITFIRGLYYHPFLDRVFVFDNPIFTFKTDLTDQQSIDNPIAPTEMGYGMCGDPFKGELYLSVSPSKVAKMNVDGTGYTVLASSPYTLYPGQNQIDTCTGTLYWTDMSSGAVLSVNVEGSPNVQFLFRHTENVCGMDVDFEDKKIYWCAKVTGKVFVYDMVSMNQTELVGDEGRGHCYCLRLYNGCMYLTHLRSDHIVKRHLNGTFVAELLSGYLSTVSEKKYMTLLV